MKEKELKKKRSSINKAFKGKIVAIISSIIILLFLAIKIDFNKLWPRDKKEEWITVFTHGSFGSVIGLIDALQVFEDKIADTKYKKIISKMRKNPIFYRSQPILQRGLIKIEPTFDLDATSNNKFAAYPMLNIYKIIQKQINPNEKNHFYTFGWSGLMSQKRRRKEAIRFYNALSEELAKYKQQGIKPKLRILTHSHGGNLALNLAAVKTTIKNRDNFDSFIKNIQNKDEKESLKLMFERIQKLPANKNLTKKKGQKTFDYITEKIDLVINELIMFGTPIQPETECFAFNNIFKKIYSLYSEEDIVQEMDFISTKNNYSEQRLTILDKINHQTLTSKKYPKITQVKVMIGHKLEKKLSENNEEYEELALNSDSNLAKTNKDAPKNFWSKLFSKSRFSSKKSKDPTHKELWFFNWKKAINIQDYFEILPTVVFTPLIKKAIRKVTNTFNDIDLNLNLTNEKLNIYVFKHNNPKVQNSISINRKILDQIKPKILMWKPDDSAYSLEFEAIKEYSSNI